jgi:rSAM/selenodomain-associated transferase 1
MRRALIVVGKAPTPGKTKTRLTPPLSAPQAAELYRAFLLDTLEMAAGLGWERTCLVHPRGDGRVLAELLRDTRVELLEQRSGGLGDALAYAFEHHFALGFETVVLIGSDNPTLSPRPVTHAEKSLGEDADLVIGPTVDGGYYLIGMQQPHLGVFEDIEWSTPRVYGQTVERAHREGLRMGTVEQWYDVDEVADLERVWQELNQAAAGLARHTRAVLERLSSTIQLVPGASGSLQTAQRTLG